MRTQTASRSKTNPKDHVKKILVIGSVAFDLIFSVSDDFRKSIPLENGEISNFNASYLANEKKEFPGGTAGNIAFWLGQEESPATVFSAWGKDFALKGYRERLEKSGTKFRGHEGDYTATAYMISDPLHQQLIIWQANAYAKNDDLNLVDHINSDELADFDYAIFSAGTPASITKHIQEFRQANPDAIVIFDPGQISQFFTKEDFQTCCKHANILIGNDTEFKYFQGYGIPTDTAQDKQLIQIETLGADGVLLREENNEEQIKTNPVENPVETTGAGDAFRAGLIASLAKGQDLKTACLRGAELGAKVVTLESGQEAAP
jgi:adenosine kinase